MKIKVTKFERVASSYHITFADVLLAGNDEFTTDVGTRVARILNKHGASSVLPLGFLSERVVSVSWPAQSSVFRSLETVQDALDKDTNTPLKVRLGPIEVLPYNFKGRRRRKLSTMAAVRRFRATYPEGLLAVERDIHLENLPSAHRDMIRLQRMSGFEVLGRDNPNVISTRIVLMGSLTNADPWQLMNQYEPQIKKAIV